MNLNSFAARSAIAPSKRRLIIAALAWALILIGPLNRTIAADTLDYARDVFPILERHCLACHTAEEAQGGLVMESYATVIKGGDSGPAVTPGTPTSSRLYMMAAGQMEPVMPPDGAERPTEVELATIASWIEQGAKGPAGEVAMRRELRTPDIKVADDIKLPVTSVALSPDGTTRAIASYRDVQVLASDSGMPITRIEPQPGKVNSLQYSRDGSQLLIASGVTGLYGRAAVYEAETGALRTAFEGHEDVIQVAIFSPDEKSIATASYDHEIILWDVATAQPKQRFAGHNGAVYALAFSPDGRVLVSGCADETVKVWDVDSGQRLDTMSQPTDEVFSVAVTRDGSFAIAGSADNRLRVWRLLSRDQPRINPIVATRFVDESPLTHLALTNDGTRLVVVSEAGNVKVLRTSDWNQVAVLEPLGETASDLVVTVDDRHAIIPLMNGQIVERELPAISHTSVEEPTADEAETVYLDLGTLTAIDESVARKESGDKAGRDHPVKLARGSEVTGTIAAPGEEDWFAVDARQGEMWVVETDTSGMNSSLDSIIEILDEQARPILQTRLQATRDSYFTFRGKNSTQNDDFRIFAWEEMKLDEYLYAAGEVTRLWMAPRGSDSGFNVYPGRGNRWTYFGTTGAVHALGEPAYIVRPLDADEAPAANGLPVFELHYANDDDPSQQRGKDSYVLFKAPATGRYLIRLRDTRGEGGEGYKYRLRVRPAVPSFRPSVDAIKAPIRRGAGRELQVIVDRIDGYDGEVWFEIDDLPAGLHCNFPVRVQPGQSFAIGNIWADADAKAWEGEVAPNITARATIGGKRVERPAGTAGKLTLADRPRAIIEIVSDSLALPAAQSDRATVQIHRGDTISLLVKADRVEGFTNEISLGKELAGRNMPHGVYVDNIGLNGLLVRENESERQFFVTAAPNAELGIRDFFLTGAVDGNVTSRPIQLEVLP
ncbi:MAG: c-type cytochrome domain-containing protein [Planctomycetaceae bacterium]